MKYEHQSDLPTTAIGALRIMPASKQEAGRFAAQVINSVKAGDVNPHEVLVLLRALQNVSETVLDGIKENINTETERYSEKRFEAYGATLEKAELATRYKYELSGDREWERRKAGVDAALNLLKEREAFLRALKEPMTAVDEESGEVFRIVPPPKFSTSGIKVFL
jgi:hypothetical protein